MEAKIKAKRIRKPLDLSELKRDLEKYVKKAIEFGATDAKIIRAKDVTIDERVRLKCMFPRCHLFGESPNCPPYTPTPDEMRKALYKYNYAVVFKHDVIPKEDFIDDERWHKAHMDHQGKTDELVSKIEALAFNDGYYFAVGFGAGGCKTALCKGQICQFLDSGRCRFPLVSRPSMEAVGIDVYDLATKVDWEIYPIGIRDVDPDSIKCAISVGIVFVA